MNIAVFPGSFDPFTKGHESIVRRALPLFDQIIIAIGINAEKKYMFSLEKREHWIRATFADTQKVRVENYMGLTVNFCRNVNAQYILRGLRNTVDLEFEKGIAQLNKTLANEIETVFMMPTLELSAINSTIIRDIVRNGGDASSFVPSVIDLKN
ncbi:MAG: pantetheine-phosphate adenylyltransferase [Bacteroidia bacterium]